MKLYDNIKRLRLEQNMTQDELAQKVGYTSRSSINKIEAGKVDLSQSKIIEFAAVLGVTPAYLMGWDDPEDKPVAPSDSIDPEVTKMAEEVQNISDEKAKSNVIQLNRLAIKSPDKVAALLKIFEPAEPTEDMPDDDDFNE